MKIHVDNVDLASSTGPNTAARRLIAALRGLGHQVLDGADGADASLVFIEPSGRRLARRIVQRLDGIWTKPDEYAWRNASIRALYHAADAVIWQSDFDRRVTTNLWGKPRSGRVVRNGVPIARVTPTDDRLIALRRAHDALYVSSSNWHRQKRLRENIELFFAQRSAAGAASPCLVVMGKHPDVIVNDPAVVYTGTLPHDLCSQVYAAADWMFHLAWGDHCPNVVVEALAQGCPVACSAVGGTAELVGSYGIVVPDRPYDHGPFDYDDPPAIDPAVLRSVSLPRRDALGDPPVVDVRSMAESYINTIESII